MYRQIERHQLCLAKCDLHKTGGHCFNWHIQKCKGACDKKETAEAYNERVTKVIESVSFKSESFFILTKGREESEVSIVCIENGQYKGFGFIDTSFGQPNLEEMQTCIKKYAHNRDIQNILCGFLKQKHLKIPYNPNNIYAQLVEI